MKARIFKPSKTAMQSGSAKTEGWILEYESNSAKRPDSLMGWTQSSDTLHQVRLKFSSLESAQAFAQERGLETTILPPHKKKIKARNYSDNFRYVPPQDSGKA